MRKLNKNPVRFRTEKEESAFWAKADTLDYITPGSVRRAMFPSLKPTSRPVPLRLPIGLLDRIKVMAHKRDIPYQSLIKTWLVREAGGETYK